MSEAAIAKKAEIVKQTTDIINRLFLTIFDIFFISCDSSNFLSLFNFISFSLSIFYFLQTITVLDILSQF